MYIDDDSLYLWERHALPEEWQELLLAYRGVGATASVVAAVQGIVRRHGHLSIMLWQVQEFALFVSGIDRLRFPTAYEYICHRLVELGGSDWPLLVALGEHLRGTDHVTQLPNRFVSCEGEWRALLRLAAAGWRPVQRDRERLGADWVVRKGEQELSVEVKTKHPLASAAGRLTRAFLGLGMLREYAFLRDLDFSWDVDDHVNDATVRAFIEAFVRHAGTIAQLESAGHVTRTILQHGNCALSLSVRAQHSCTLDFRRIDTSARTAEVVRRITIETRPAAVADHVFTGGGSARSSDGPATELPLTDAAFKRLLRGNQMRRLHHDTLLLVVWHMPFHALSYDTEILGAFWRRWCEDHGVRRGALQRIPPMGSDLPMLVSDAALELDLR